MRTRRVLGGLAGGIAVAALLAATAAHPGAPLRNGKLQGSDSISVNWAGYVAAGTSFSHVSATWIEPLVACKGTHPLDASSFWIGLGGANRSSPGLEQTGTSADCVRGRARYYAWYEVLPAPATNISFDVAPGQAVVADVDVANGVTAFSLRNLTTGTTFQRTVPVRSAAVDSAEWIAEAPSECASGRDCRTLPLARFSAVLFTSASATASAHTGPIGDGGWSAEAIRLASRSNELTAAPSVLSADGTSFSIATHGPRTKTLLPGLQPLSALHTAAR